MLLLWIFVAKMLSPILMVGGMVSGWLVRSPRYLAAAIVGLVIVDELLLQASSQARASEDAGVIVLSCAMGLGAANLWALLSRSARRRR